MKTAIAKNRKTFGMMTKRVTEFDAKAVRAAVTVVADHASTRQRLSEASRTDPKPEARSEISTSFEDFSAKMSELESIAVGPSASIGTPDDPEPAMRSHGASCGSCCLIHCV